MTIEMGMKVKDKISDFEGIVTARIEYINGCVQYRVSPKVDKDGKVPDSLYIDAEQLEVVETVESAAVRIQKAATGGPSDKAPQGNTF